MKERRDLKVHMIPLEHITVVNPRERGKRKFKQIVDNIASLGLKKPITVTPKETASGVEEYYLVCGQGRYEAYKILGEREIPALVVHVTKEELLLMSLVENLARRQHSSIELFRDISDLRDRGYSFTDIAAKTALDVTYVRGMVKLLKKGEERLLQAVEKGQMMRETKKLFAEYARCRDGTINHATLRRNLQPVRKTVEGLLLRGFGTAARGMCKELYNHKEHLWTFLSDPDVEPTNNASERSLRHGVIWRKLSFGTQSDRGDRFVETLLTVIETCRKQGRSVLGFITAALDQTNTPTTQTQSLLPNTA